MFINVYSKIKPTKYDFFADCKAKILVEQLLKAPLRSKVNVVGPGGLETTRQNAFVKNKGRKMTFAR